MARVETRSFPLEQLIEQVREGRLRVPRFQRQFVWRYEQVRNLLDSIARGYPVGTLLIWSTPERYSSFGELGPIQLPIEQPPKPTAVGYLLDGHQRVSTLVGTLSLSEDEAAAASGQARAFILYYDLDEEEFVHERAPKEQHLPMRYLLAKDDALTRWIDERRDRTTPDTSERTRWDRNRRRAFTLQTIFSQYRLPYLEVTNADLAEAVQIFVLLNTQGTGAKRHEVFAALSWRQGGFDFGRAAHELLEHHTDFRNLGTDPILRALLVSLDESLYEDDWSKVEEKHGQQLERSFETVSEAFGRATEFVSNRFGASSGKVLPYALHLILLTEFFRRCPQPAPAQEDVLEHWLWASSFSLAYSGATNIAGNAAVKRIKEIAAGKGTRLLDPPVIFSPTPATYHPKSARVRTTHLFLKHCRPLDLRTGKPLEDDILVDGMADGESIAGKAKVSWRIAGRLLVPSRQRKHVRHAIQNLRAHPKCDEIIASHLIPRPALDALLMGDEDTFLQLREEALVNAERDFAKRFVELPNRVTTEPEPLIDVEDEEASDFF